MTPLIALAALAVFAAVVTTGIIGVVTVAVRREEYDRPPRHPIQRHAMPPAPPALNAVTSAREQAASGTRAPAPVTPGHGPRTARALLAGRAQTVRAVAACSDRTGRAPTPIRGDRLRCVTSLLRRVPKTGGSFYDPLFGWPDLVEDDYYRFWRQPRGW